MQRIFRSFVSRERCFHLQHKTQRANAQKIRTQETDRRHARNTHAAKRDIQSARDRDKDSAALRFAKEEDRFFAFGVWGKNRLVKMSSSVLCSFSKHTDRQTNAQTGGSARVYRLKHSQEIKFSPLAPTGCLCSLAPRSPKTRAYSCHALLHRIINASKTSRLNLASRYSAMIRVCLRSAPHQRFNWAL